MHTLFKAVNFQHDRINEERQMRPIILRVELIRPHHQQC